MARSRKLDDGFLSAYMKDVRGWRDTYLRHQPKRQNRLAKPEHIYDSQGLAYDFDNPGRKFLIGGLRDKAIGIDDGLHHGIVAGSGAGKSVTIAGNLLHARGVSTFCIDPKGELSRLTAMRRHELGHRVHILDPFGLVNNEAEIFRARFNPLATLTPDNPYLIEDAGQIADGIVIQTGREPDPHWPESAKELIQLAILHTVTAPRYQGRRTLVTVRELLASILTPLPGADEDGPQYVVQADMLENAHRLLMDEGEADLAMAIEGAATSFFDKPDRERGGVLSTARRHTMWLDYPSMKDVLSGHDFDLDDLRADYKGMSVYLCLPATRLGTCAGWLKAMLNSLFVRAERVASGNIEEENRRPPVWVFLDEMPILGHSRQIEDAAGLVRSLGLKLFFIIQDINQIKALYRDRWETFFGNAGVWQFFGNTDNSTLEYMSKRLGKVPVETGDVMVRNQNELTAPARARQITTDDAMAPEECALVFGRNDELKRQLVIMAGVAPMILQRVAYYDKRGPFRRWFAGTYPEDA